jgi:regulator of protease activity HflC (stomatin/prohibitin superfamily)
MAVTLGLIAGFVAFFLTYCLLGGLYTVNQNERAVITNFGKAERLNRQTTLDLLIAEALNAEERARYVYPQLRVIQPGGPYLRPPWQRVYKASLAIQTINVAFDPDMPSANEKGTTLDAVTKDQLNIKLTGQLRYKVSEQNLYAYFFGIKQPVSHIIGYFILSCENGLLATKRRCSKAKSPQRKVPTKPWRRLVYPSMTCAKT